MLFLDRDCGLTTDNGQCAHKLIGHDSDSGSSGFRVGDSRPIGPLRCLTEHSRGPNGKRPLRLCGLRCSA